MSYPFTSLTKMVGWLIMVVGLGLALLPIGAAASPRTTGCGGEEQEATGERGASTIVLPADCASIVQSLNSLTAISMGERVIIAWETSGESRNLGFNLYRGTSNEAPSAPLNDQLIASRAGGGQGATYEWLDYEVVRGRSYYYWLEDVDASGTRNLHGPVIVLHQAPTAVTLATLNSQPPAASPRLWGLLGLVGALALSVLAHRRMA